MIKNNNSLVRPQIQPVSWGLLNPETAEFLPLLCSLDTRKEMRSPLDPRLGFHSRFYRHPIQDLGCRFSGRCGQDIMIGCPKSPPAAIKRTMSSQPPAHPWPGHQWIRQTRQIEHRHGGVAGYLAGVVVSNQIEPMPGRRPVRIIAARRELGDALQRLGGVAVPERGIL
jgi:hypothetical protein